MDMTNQRLEDIKSAILLSEKVEKFQYDTWIDPIERIQFRGSALYVWAPSPLAVHAIEKNYLDVIEDAAFQIMNREYEVIILSPGDEIPVNGMIPAKRAETEPKKDFYLNPKYTFRTFVVGNSNKLAHAYSLMVAENPGDEIANPLFIYGGSGLGKTHLSQAIAHFIQSKNADAKIMYVAAETYTNEYIRSLQDKTTDRFRDKYRNVDLLIVDDIQFICGKEATVTEFFNTFNDLHAKKKQIVLTSDRFPKQLKGIDERLVGRFISGCTCDVNKPDFETRVAILKNNCLAENINLSEDIINFIADKIKSNVRELEGALNKIVSFYKLNSNPITLQTAEQLLKDYVFAESTKADLTYDLVKEKTAEYFGITVEDIMGPKRPKNIVAARQIAIFIAFNKVKKSNVTSVAREFQRDHATISHALKKIEEELLNNEETAMAVQDIVSHLTEE